KLLKVAVAPWYLEYKITEKVGGAILHAARGSSRTGGVERLTAPNPRRREGKGTDPSPRENTATNPLRGETTVTNPSRRVPVAISVALVAALFVACVVVAIRVGWLTMPEPNGSASGRGGSERAETYYEHNLTPRS